MSLNFKKKLLPAVTLYDADSAVNLAGALLGEGLDTMEITFRTPAAIPAIRSIVREFPGMNIGAGTILTVNQVEEARDAGAGFGLAPGFNETVLDKAEELDFPFIPGVMTSSEIEKALERGIRLLKLFPVNNLGGPSYVKSLQGPYHPAGVRFIPMGGINLSNLKEYLRLRVVTALGGSWMTPETLIANGEFEKIRNYVRQSMKIVGEET